jgi:sterol desaturase/sphingolipid hydroxylase (fatty acid hydroxylase superfamily)
LAACIALWFAEVHFLEFTSFQAAIGGTILMLVGVNVFEQILPRPDAPPRPKGTIAVDLGFNLLSILTAIIVPSFIYIPFGHDAATVLGTDAMWQGLPLWAATCVAILAVDFFSYWWHRLQHLYGDTWMWHLHSVHHAPTYYDFWMGARVHPVDVLGFGLTGYGLVSLLGAPMAAVEFTAYFAALIGAVHHTRAQTDCSWFNRFITMGDHHIMHHSANEEDNGNFGNIFTFFDTLFGTYIKPSPEVTPPQGAWSLIEDYPLDKFWFILATPFGRFWKKVKRPIEEAAPETEPDPSQA